MSPQRVRAHIIELLRRLIPDKCHGIDLDEHTRLVDQLGLDSVELLRLFGELEGHYDIDLFESNRGAQGYETVGSLARWVRDLSE